MNEYRAEITVFEKSGGPLTKRLALRDNKIVTDTSACFMAHGVAHRVKIDNVQALADLINNFAPNQAYALGRLKDGVRDGAKVVPRDKLNGAGDPSVIARTKEYLVFNKGKPGLALLDMDVKGMSEVAAHRMEECGDFWGALCEVFPALESVACVERASTSSGLRHGETGESIPGSGGRHIVIPVLDAADIPRFLSDLHDRCWLAGLGWGMVSAAGSFLERSLIDKTVGSPERLIFEGAPIIDPPLEQKGRDAVAHDGAVLDTRLCLPLTDGEKSELQKLKAAEERRLLPKRQAARSAWSLKHVERLIARGIPESESWAEVERWIDRRELTDTFELPFDKRDLAGTTVADVLADPGRFINETMADPHEGPAYGRGKAIIFRRGNGSLFVNSFAHGGITYELKATSTVDDDAELERLARLSPLEYGRARREAAKQLGVSVSLLDAAVRAKRRELGIDKNDSQQGHAVEYEEPEPWPDPVDVGALLDEIAQGARRFVVLPKHGAEKVALWVAHTYVPDATDFSPRLEISAPERECGKSTLLDFLEQIVYRPDPASNITTAALFRTVEQFRPTLLIDEVDSFASEDSDIRNVLNSGHHVRGRVKRTVGDDHAVRSFSTFAAVAYAHIGELPQAYNTLVDRSISIGLSRRLPEEKIESLSGPRRRNEFKHLRLKLARFAQDDLAALAAADPDIPEGVFNRVADNWRPLLAIADLAGPEWGTRARAAIDPPSREGSIREMLLGDINEIFERIQPNDGFISSTNLAVELATLGDRPWAEYGRSQKPITTKKVANLLKPEHRRKCRWHGHF